MTETLCMRWRAVIAVAILSTLLGLFLPMGLGESVPLDSSMLYKSDEKLTDLTDQELFFEIPVQELLTKHNALRATLLDKAATKRSNKDVMLEPAKIRDLTMTVLVLETW